MPDSREMKKKDFRKKKGNKDGQPRTEAALSESSPGKNRKDINRLKQKLADLQDEVADQCGQTPGSSSSNQWLEA